MATLLKSHSLELIVDEKILRDCQGNETLAWEATRNKGSKMMYSGVRNWPPQKSYASMGGGLL